MDTSLDFESISSGTPVEGIAIPALNRVILARYAGATDDFNPIHLDDKVALAAGKASVFAPTTLIMGYVGRMVEAWLQGAALRRFGMRMLRLVWPGDVLTCRGMVVDKRKEDHGYVIDLDVWADNQRGETVAKGRVIAMVPASQGKRLRTTTVSPGVIYHPAPVLNAVLTHDRGDPEEALR